MARSWIEVNQLVQSYITTPRKPALKKNGNARKWLVPFKCRLRVRQPKITSFELYSLASHTLYYYVVLHPGFSAQLRVSHPTCETASPSLTPSYIDNSEQSTLLELVLGTPCSAAHSRCAFRTYLKANASPPSHRPTPTTTLSSPEPAPSS